MFNGIVYNIFKNRSMEINIMSSTLKVVLMDFNFTPDNTQEFLSDINATGFEVSGSGYTAGGKEILNKSIVESVLYDGSAVFGDNISWPSSTFIASSFVVYIDTGDATTSILVLAESFAGHKEVSNETFELIWNPAGILKVV